MFIWQPELSLSVLRLCRLRMVWYLAFGSNMSTKVLVDRRKIEPSESHPVVVQDYQLTFNVPGIPYWEPSFASILPRKGKKLHGVIYNVSEQDFKRIQRSEGGAGIKGLGYQPVDIAVTTYSGDKYIARTLYYNCNLFPNIREFHPSKRYLNLILDGAMEHHLDADYIGKLENLQYYDACSISEKVSKYLFLFPVFLTVVPFAIVYFTILKNFHISVDWLLKTVHYMLYLLYLFHDLIWIKVLPGGLKEEKMVLNE